MEILVSCHPPIFKHYLTSLDSSHIWQCKDVFTVCIRAVRCYFFHLVEIESRLSVVKKNKIISFSQSQL